VARTYCLRGLQHGYSRTARDRAVVGGHKTSVSLEDDFWDALKEIAREHRVTLSDLVGSLDEQRQHGNLSSALRLLVLNHYRRRVADETERSGARPANGEMQLAKGPD
jgi:predicted DNA-binding ribbon-helix-helix protein